MKRLRTNDDIIDYIKKPHIELIGNTECIIEGMKSIIEYTKGRIKVDTGKMNVTISGDGLYINSFTPDGATVEGEIVALEFESNA